MAEPSPIREILEAVKHDPTYDVEDAEQAILLLILQLLPEPKGYADMLASPPLYSKGFNNALTQFNKNLINLKT